MDILLAGAPVQSVEQARSASLVALLGEDYPGLRPHFEVGVGDAVARGQTLFVDRRRSSIAFTSPVSGTVAAITRGERRRLDAITISASGERVRRFDSATPSDPASLRRVLLSSGLWTSFRTRPFERIPDPDADTAAIFVTAIDTAPLAADPAVVISRFKSAFGVGIDALTALTEGRVFVCQSPGDPLVHDTGQVRAVAFTGPHPAGLPGTHIHHLLPAGASRTVWHIGYQDVIAIGQLLATGEVWGERIVALTGPNARQPRLVRVAAGADLDELTGAERTEPDTAIISGSILHGRASRFLGRYHSQVTLLPARSEAPERLGAWLTKLLSRPAHDAIIPVTAYERVVPLDILPVPLLRALSVGDFETAERLGCLELAEDDLALLGHVCPTGGSYGALLRRALNEIGATA